MHIMYPFNEFPIYVSIKHFPCNSFFCFVLFYKKLQKHEHSRRVDFPDITAKNDMLMIHVNKSFCV